MKNKVLPIIGFIILLVCFVDHPKYYKKLPKSKQEYVGVWFNKTQGSKTLIGIGKDRGLVLFKTSGFFNNCLTYNSTLPYLNRTPSFENQKIKIPGFLPSSKHTYSIDSPPSQKSGDWVMTLNGKRFRRVKDELTQVNYFGFVNSCP